MGWTCRLIYTLRVSGSLGHVVPRETKHPCRKSRACNKFKIKYLIKKRIKMNKIISFILNRKFCFMVDAGVMFGGVISFVAGPRSLVESELNLGLAALHPKLVHFHGIDIIVDDRVVGDTNSGGVVSLNRKFGWGPCHLNMSLAKWDLVLVRDEESCQFGLGDLGHDRLDDLG